MEFTLVFFNIFPIVMKEKQVHYLMRIYKMDQKPMIMFDMFTGSEANEIMF
jgi:hypothetical protein